MTKDEFEKQYTKGSNVTIEWLHERGQHVFPCDCGEQGCCGWKMVNIKLESWTDTDQTDSEQK
ncbi:hypothetical protein LCGC14_0542280 [marine sediment metagenome]|uniref:Post-SET domain-containing protein n=1 Tax=marine sediment metagenome TaxID=412755 RepID=A0A0F9V0K9_9ZZZZ